jgi:hypothetical protein
MLRNFGRGIAPRILGISLAGDGVVWSLSIYRDRCLLSGKGVNMDSMVVPK